MKAIESAKVTSFMQEHDVYLFGPMGVGKTTLIENLRGIVDLEYVSMGEVTRQEIANGNENVIRTIQKGGKIPLSFVQGLIAPRITTSGSYVLDGVPRHVDEAVWIKQHAEGRHLGSVALTLTAEDNMIVERIAQRRTAGLRQETPERVAARLQVYRENYDAVLETLRPALHQIVEIDTTDLMPEEVIEEFCERIA